MRHFTTLLIALTLTASGSALAQADAEAQTASVLIEGEATAAQMIDLNTPARTDEEKARDKYRHPVQTLAFFQTDPRGKIGEYAPGGGWYSRILAPWIASNGGTLVGLGFSPDATPFPDDRKEALRNFPQEFPAKLVEWSGARAPSFGAVNLDNLDGQEGTFDQILVIRMLHNLNRWGMIDSELTAMNTLLKPGGTIGIVQHRAPESAPENYVDGNKGYMKQSDVIAIMERNGFELVGTSEVNANAKDTADYEDGVWTLPPANRGVSEEDAAKYKEIGESDRMTLLFRKKD